MIHLWKNIVRLVLAGLLIIPQTFWINRLRFSSTRWPEYVRGDFDPLTLSLFVVIDGLLVVYLIGMVVVDMIAQKPETPPWIKTFAQQGLAGFLVSRYHAIRTVKTKSIISFIITGILILLFISILSTSQIFDRHSLLFFDFIARPRMQEKDTLKTVYFFNYFTEDDNNEQYIKDLFKMAKDFKDVGVKAVVADWPVNIYEKDSLSHAIIDSLILNYNVIFSDYPQFYIKKFLPPISHSPAAKFYLGPSVYSTEDIWEGENYMRTIVRWYPYRWYQSSAYNGYHVESDVSLLVAEKYFGEQNYSMFENHQIVLERRKIVGTNFAVPITSDGIAYSKLRWDWTRYAPVSASREVGGSGKNKAVPDTLVYHFQIVSGNSSHWSNEDTLRHLQAYKKYFEKKIVLINWIDESNGRSRNIMPKFKAASIINSTVRNENYEKLDGLNYLSAIVSMILIGAVIRRSKIVFGLIVSVLFVIGVTATGIWLFFAKQIIIDFLYPVTAILLSFIVYSLLKLSLDSDR